MASITVTVNDPWRLTPKISRSHHYLMVNILGTVQLEWTTNRDLRSTQECRFEWPWVTLGDLAKCSMIRGVARSLCGSWASCHKDRLNRCCTVRTDQLNWLIVRDRIISEVHDHGQERNGEFYVTVAGLYRYFDQTDWKQQPRLSQLYVAHTQMSYTANIVSNRLTW